VFGHQQSSRSHRQENRFLKLKLSVWNQYNTQTISCANVINAVVHAIHYLRLLRSLNHEQSQNAQVKYPTVYKRQKSVDRHFDRA
jgi:hypothetical protein